MDSTGSLHELSSCSSERFEGVRTRADDPALLIYTSGTTGPPKGVLHAHRVLIGHLPGFERAHNHFPQRDSVGWTPADWAWMGGLMDLWPPCWHYGRPVVAHPCGPFEPKRVLAVAREYGARNVFLPPTALRLIRRAGVTEGPRLNSILTGGEVLGAEMLDWCEEVFGVTPNEIYGQTEANLVVGNDSVSAPVVPGSMGRPYPGHAVAVVDEVGAACPAGEIGEIVVAADDPVAFLGYWNQSEATARKRRDGWIHTGDRAHADESGFLFFSGRDDDIINSGSYRIGPSEIEACLQRHPQVGLAAVIGAPDELRGEIVKAFLVLRPCVEPTEQLKREIRQLVRERLAAYEYPREIEFVDELPLTTTGKIRRAVLRERERAARIGD